MTRFAVVCRYCGRLLFDTPRIGDRETHRLRQHLGQQCPRRPLESRQGTFKELLDHFRVARR